MESIPISKKELLTLLDKVLSDDDSLSIEVSDISDVRYLQKLDGNPFPHTKLVQSDDVIKITAAWGLKWWTRKKVDQITRQW